jgi:hypothetical protein
VTRLLDLGYSPVSYDALGHGATPGAAGTILDHLAIIRRLAEEHGPFEGVVAHSLGVHLALYAVRQRAPAKRVVAISGFSDFAFLVDAFCTELRLRHGHRALRRRIERVFFEGDADIWTKYSASDPTGWSGERGQGPADRDGRAESPPDPQRRPGDRRRAHVPPPYQRRACRRCPFNPNVCPGTPPLGANE